MPRPTANLQLSIDVDSDPITGSVSNGLCRSQPFNGWIELVAAIEAARISGHQAAGADDAGLKTLGSFPGAKASAL